MRKPGGEQLRLGEQRIADQQAAARAASMRVESVRYWRSIDGITLVLGGRTGSGRLCPADSGVLQVPQHEWRRVVALPRPPLGKPTTMVSGMAPMRHQRGTVSGVAGLEPPSST
jgi:hypothetical protein